jgi:cytoskeleton protein RodZ
MSEITLSDNAPIAHADEVSTSLISAGAMLRNAREAEGLHIAALAVMLKVPVKKLEALEANQFDLLPDIVFVRALAASICRTLKIDQTQILESLPQTAAPHLKTDESGINKPFRTYGNASGVTFLNQLTKPVVLSVVALLVGVIVIIFLPLTDRTDEAVIEKYEMRSVVPTIAAPASGVMSSGYSVSADEVASAQATILPSSSSGALVPLYPVSAASSTSMSATALNAPPVTGSGLTTGIVVFTARGSSWVEVVDANGVVQVRKTMTNGEVVGVSGAMPLMVVVGRANTTEVQVRGIPFDLLRIAKDNVARFEVK